MVTDLKDFTADEARALAKSKEEEHLLDILAGIKEAAALGDTSYYYDISDKWFKVSKISDQLRTRGFVVTYSDDQKDGQFFKISW